VLTSLPQLASLVSQPIVLAAGLTAGVAVGAVGVGTGAIPVTDPPPHKTALYECPGSGRIVTSIAPDQNVLVTARSADGQWLQIYVGEAVAERGWAPASSLRLKAAPDSLPVEDCTPDATAEPGPTSLQPPSGFPSAAPSTGPSAGGPTAAPVTLPPAATATPKPTKTPSPTPTKVPTPPPTPPTGPQLSNLIVVYPETKDSGTGHYFVTRPSSTCPSIAAATIHVTATDPDGVSKVTLWYQPQGGAPDSVDMPYHDLDAGIYEQSFYVQNAWADGIIDYWVEAEDTVGDISIIHDNSSNRLELAACP
jgi:hypothetical protein